MRIATSTIYALGVTSIQQQTSDLMKTQQQVSSGRRIVSPSDDPVGAAQVLNLTQSLDINQQRSANATSAQNNLEMEDSVLSSIDTLIQDVKTTAINAGNAALSDGDRASMAADLQGKLNELIGLANSTDAGGVYMFAGYKGSTVPFSLTATGVPPVSYNGDQGQRLVTIGATRQIPVSDSGSDVFFRIKNGNGTFVTTASATNTGTGVIDTGTVVNVNSWNASSRDFTINFTSSTTYDIVDNVSGSNIVTGATYTSGSAISFNGAQFSIQGAPVAGDTFTVKASTSQDLFTTISNLITTLQTPVSGPAGQAALSNGLNGAMSNLDNALNNILTTRASVGARLQEISAVQSMGEDLNLQYQQVISQLQDVDYAQSISDLNRQQVGLQAAQKTFVTVQSLSLFQYLP